MHGPFAYHFIVLTIDSIPDCPIRAISQLFYNLIPVIIGPMHFSSSASLKEMTEDLTYSFCARPFARIFSGLRETAPNCPREQLLADVLGSAVR